ncbi:hypothetical protein DdX_02212 [Ditylenchus destructor]|uniref:Uncharacterized protein n=1 Tax=Ditylenchus destructor TaxID=166010 RepID=A0AAD4R5U3_9BILA|nr:hypothetical protein DdX_02212 [Ditylenchus destructor]
MRKFELEHATYCFRLRKLLQRDLNGSICGMGDPESRNSINRKKGSVAWNANEPAGWQSGPDGFGTAPPTHSEPQMMLIMGGGGMTQIDKVAPLLSKKTLKCVAYE